MAESQAIYDGPGLAGMADAILAGDTSAGGGSSAVYDGPGLMSMLDAVLEPEAG